MSIFTVVNEREMSTICAIEPTSIVSSYNSFRWIIVWSLMRTTNKFYMGFQSLISIPSLARR